MTKEEYLQKCEEVEDTAHAEKGHPQIWKQSITPKY